MLDRYLIQLLQDFQAILEKVPDLYLIITPTLEIVEVSDSYCKATMVKREDVMGKNVFEVFPENPNDLASVKTKENYRASIQRVLDLKLADTMAVNKYDIRRPIDDGGHYEERYWSPVNVPVLGEDGEVKYIITRVEDVTEFIKLKKYGKEQSKIAEELQSKAGEMEMEIYQRAQQIQEVNKQLRAANEELKHKEKVQEDLYIKLEQLNQLKTQFFANISHELRTPLTLMLAPIEKLLAEESLLYYQHDLKIIERNARSLLKLVNDLLDVAKLEAGKMKINYAEVDLAKIVRTTAALFEDYAKDHDIKFVVEVPRTLPAEIDPKKIERVIMNLLSNAFKFTPEGRTVTCKLIKTNMHAQIIVVDGGPGIPDALHDAVFERFFQVEEPTTRNHGGTGLGLAIVKDFIELHGGTIKIHNEPPEGAVFTIDLPMLAPPNVLMNEEFQDSNFSQGIIAQILDELISPEKKPEPVKAKLEPEKSNLPLILIVEDNVDMNQHLSEILQKHYRIITAMNGQEGLEKTLESQPDLILTDIMMPKMNGVQMVHEIRKHAELKNISIIVLTAKADDELCVKMLSEGAQDYIAKPFAKEELEARIANSINLKKAKDEVNQKSMMVAVLLNILQIMRMKQKSATH